MANTITLRKDRDNQLSNKEFKKSIIDNLILSNSQHVPHNVEFCFLIK